VDVVPDAGSAATGAGAWCIAGEKGSAVPGMSAELVKAKVGKEIEATLPFPKDYPNEKLQGKKVDYTITVKVIRKRILPALDEAFCKRLGTESIEELKTKMRQRMEEEAINREHARRRDEAMGYLIKNTKLEIPQSLVAQETRAAVSDIVQMSMRQGMTEDQLRQQQAEIVKTAGDMAQQRVRVSFILAKIAKEENIDVSKAETDERIAQMAKAQNMDVAKMRADLEERYGLDGVINEIRCNKAMAFVLDNVKD
jgi:trigger factor